MDPFTIMAIISTVTSAIGSYQQGQAAEEQGEYNAALQRQQAEEEARARGKKEAEERRYTNNRQKSLQAQYARSGVMLEGTPVQMLMAQARTDEANILENDRTSQIRQQGLRQQAQVSLIMGEAQKNNANLQAIAGLVGAAAMFGSGLDSGEKGGKDSKNGKDSKDGDQ